MRHPASITEACSRSLTLTGALGCFVAQLQTEILINPLSLVLGAGCSAPKKRNLAQAAVTSSYLLNFILDGSPVERPVLSRQTHADGG